MSEFPRSASPENPAQQSQAFQAALIKAQQIAARIKPAVDSESSSGGGVKRPLEEDLGSHTEIKKPTLVNTFPNMEGGGVTSEQIMVPDKMVGMIIGRGGEQITRLQADSGCKIQMAQDSGGMPDRMCTLTGPANAIAQAKAMIDGIISSGEVVGGGGPMGGGRPMGGGGGGQMELMVPGHKVGLIIGKGGETIKMLQEQTGAKIIIIQESNEPTEQKPIRISGPPEAVEEAKMKVMEIINQNEDRNGGGGFRGGRGGPRGGGGMRGGFGGRGGGRGGDGPGGAGWPTGGRPGEKQEMVLVPASKVGLVIGKGGETIKSINQASGAHCEIDKQAPADANEKHFVIRGPPDAVDRAKSMVLEKIGLVQGTGYGSFPGQTFNSPNGGGGGNGYNHHNGGAGDYYQPPASSGGAAPSPAINPATGQPDYSQQWAEYYRSLGMTREAEMIQQGHQPAPGQPGGAQAGGGAPAPTPSAGAAGGGAAAGSADYSAQWAEYYRSIGKVKEAEAIENQIRSKGPGAGPGGPGGPPGGQPGYPGQPGGAPQYGGQPGYPGQPAMGGQPGFYQPQQGGYPG